MNSSKLWITVFVILVLTKLALAGSFIGDVGHIWCDADATCRVLSKQAENTREIMVIMTSLARNQYGVFNYVKDTHRKLVERQTEALEKIALKLEAISQALLPPSPPSNDATDVK